MYRKTVQIRLPQAALVWWMWLQWWHTIVPCWPCNRWNIQFRNKFWNNNTIARNVATTGAYTIVITSNARLVRRHTHVHVSACKCKLMLYYWCFSLLEIMTRQIRRQHLFLLCFWSIKCWKAIVFESLHPLNIIQLWQQGETAAFLVKELRKDIISTWIAW